MRLIRLSVVMALAATAACATASVEERSLEEQVAAALSADERPDNCELYPAGEFRIPTDRSGQVPGGLATRLRGMGYFAAQNVRQETVTERIGGGTQTERVVAISGTGLKWNDPTCALGR